MTPKPQRGSPAGDATLTIQKLARQTGGEVQELLTLYVLEALLARTGSIAHCRLSLAGSAAQVSVDAATGTDFEHEDYERAVIDPIDHAIAADADTQPARRAGERNRTGRSRIVGQILDGGDDPSADRRVDPA